ncbi:Similar to Pyruvyl transferase 1; acc. no. Q9UT27 [Pyronema omphalodes CBS 100304]|uniref:Similar to Pyruvyl transferase 1 acc. no. Q9UT27 n=1 Tax=Pyronema omphalodes (strain CBS 100304) TaxID=1076935 RepID=U4LM04_PYROM|nr:Similar to Pyruvyl transferase 1; acc. no. Q9UT27 [Pyronema omphalodes CBS 100304]
MLSTKRLTPILLAVFLLLATLFFLNTPEAISSLPAYGEEHYATGEKAGAAAGSQQQTDAAKTQTPAVVKPDTTSAKPAVAISYDKTTPPTVGCEPIVHDLQQRIISSYQTQLKGIRYANVFGYLETENKGDAAIWSAQQILMSMMGINFLEACRFTDKDCDINKFRSQLEAHAPHSAILIAGGGNFNDFYWEDQPSRIKMVSMFPTIPIRSFPQSIHMTHPDRINLTKSSFGSHPDLQLAARDQRSYNWLSDTFGQNAVDVEANKVRHILTPDIAFMWGSRPDFRLNTKKTHQVLILARDDWEVSAGNSSSIPMGEGVLDLGGEVGNVTYNKVDWKFTNTPGINDSPREEGKNQRAWAKAIQGFEMLGSADFVVTDRLHGHIMATIIGTPHVLMDSKLGKNVDFHDTWTKDCGATRVAGDIEEAKNFAKMFFENKLKEEKKSGDGGNVA